MPPTPPKKPERMSSVDTAWLRMHRPTNLMMICGVLILRKIWERELRALAEGRPLTEWSGWENIIVTDVGSRELTSVLEAKYFSLGRRPRSD